MLLSVVVFLAITGNALISEKAIRKEDRMLKTRHLVEVSPAPDPVSKFLH